MASVAPSRSADGSADGGSPSCRWLGAGEIAQKSLNFFFFTTS